MTLHIAQTLLATLRKCGPSTPTWATARKCGCSRPATCTADGSRSRTTAQRGANGTVAAASKVSDSLDACRATTPVATTSGPAGVEPQEVPDARTDLMMCQRPRLAADEEAAPGARLRGVPSLPENGPRLPVTGQAQQPQIAGRA